MAINYETGSLKQKEAATVFSGKVSKICGPEFVPRSFCTNNSTTQQSLNRIHTRSAVRHARPDGDPLIGEPSSSNDPFVLRIAGSCSFVAPLSAEFQTMADDGR